MWRRYVLDPLVFRLFYHTSPQRQKGPQIYGVQLYCKEEAEFYSPKGLRPDPLNFFEPRPSAGFAERRVCMHIEIRLGNLYATVLYTVFIFQFPGLFVA